MKNVLFGTTAIALAGAVAGPASAAEWDVKFGGFAEAFIGYAQTDLAQNVPGTLFDIDGVDSTWDGEIIFTPSITLDNGIKIGANVQLEGRAGSGGTGDVIDEAYIFVRGSFGEINIGDENSAGYKMTYAAPDVSFLGVNSPSSTIFVPYSGALGGQVTGADLFRGTLGTTFLENERNNDAGRITYYTPRFAGFQVGVSYARDATQQTNGRINTAAAAASDIIDVGANYVNSFGGFDLSLSARWGIATDNRVAIPGTDVGEDPTVLGFGASFGFAGVTIGGGWSEQNGAGDEDGTAYTAGVSYRTGPWGFSATYLHGENVDEEATAAGDNSTPLNAALGQNDETVDNYIIAVDYDLAKGVDLNLVAGYTDFDEELADGGVNNGGNDLSGFYVATGIRVRF